MFAIAKAALISLSTWIPLAPGTAVGPSEAGATTFAVSLTGREAVDISPGTAGDLDGAGLVRLALEPDQRRICYDFNVSGVSTPLMAHIHRGQSHNNGPSVVTLFTGPGGELDGCLDWTEKRLAEIVAEPSNFYVNLATTEFPDGAIRGQLQG